MYRAFDVLLCFLAVSSSPLLRYHVVKFSLHLFSQCFEVIDHICILFVISLNILRNIFKPIFITLRRKQESLAVLGTVVDFMASQPV